MVATRHAAVGQDAMPVLLGAHRAGAPAEEHNRVRTVGDALHGPQRDLPGLWRSTQYIPAGDATLLLHHPEGLVLHRADEVQLTRMPVGAVLIMARVEMPAGILIVGREIQLLTQVIIAGLAGEAHQVVGDPLVRRGSPQDIRLELVEFADQIGGKALPVQLVGGIHAPGSGDLRRRNAGEIIVALAPEGGAPGAVELVNAAVLLLQPGLEATLAMLAVAQIAVAVAQLVVHLPANDCRMRRIMGGKGGHIAADMLAVNRIGLAVMVAAAEETLLSAPVGGLDLRIAVDDPLGRRGRGRTEDHVDALGRQDVDGLVQLLKMEFAFPGLKLLPGELRHADDLDAHVVHHLRINSPAILRPVLGIIVNAELVLLHVLFLRTDWLG